MSSQPALAQRYERNRDETPLPDLWQSSDNRCKPHFHSSIELVHVTQGSLTVYLDDQKYIVQENQLMIASSYTVHRYQSDESNRETIIIIPLSFVPSMQKTLRDHAFNQPIYDLTNDIRTRTVLELLSDGWTEYNVETKKGLCYTLLGLLTANVGLSPQKNSTRTTQMKDMLIYLQENYQSNLSMEALARQFGYSKSRFSHLFNETLGCPPGAFINALRCQHAARAMLESDQPLLEIAMNAGFECPRTFYRVFKQYYGVTPTQYCNAHRTAQPSSP
ncbi:MAG: helix-turn-helix transcriptional regulator [Clostridia bacterium]|nr:helix-turn-helix transcriptional regulator [Clostridia bacterium]